MYSHCNTIIQSINIYSYSTFKNMTHWPKCSTSPDRNKQTITDAQNTEPIWSITLGSPCIKGHSQAKQNRCVNSIDLKKSIESDAPICSGRLFQRVGAATTKVQSLQVLNLGLGTFKRRLCANLKDLAAWYLCNRLEIYSGVRPYKPLNTTRKTLYCRPTLKLTGSQCKEACTGGTQIN